MDLSHIAFQQMQDLMPQYCPSSDGLVTATQLSAAGQVSLTVFLPKAQGYDKSIPYLTKWAP